MKKCTLKELFSKRGRWAKDYYAYDREGKKVGPEDEGAIKFCLVGGVRRCYGPEENARQIDRVMGKLQRAIKKLYPGRGIGVVTFNDNPKTRLKDIRAVVEEANV